MYNPLLNKGWNIEKLTLHQPTNKHTQQNQKHKWKKNIKKKNEHKNQKDILYKKIKSVENVKNTNFREFYKNNIKNNV